MVPSPPHSRAERRKKQRIHLARGVLARFGTASSVIVDLTDAGARVEHFNRLEVGRRATFRFTWQKAPIETVAMVMSCRVHRFVHGEKGATVYQSGLSFVGYAGESEKTLHDMVAAIVAHSLAEQVANARGIGPVIETSMPVFRSGVVADTPEEVTKAGQPVLPSDVVEQGYIRCRLLNGSWQKKWTRSTAQPEDGFAVPASEPSDHIDQLCETYRNADAEGRRLIQMFAALTVDGDRPAGR